MKAPIPILMIPGLNATPRCFQAQMETLWRYGPVTVTTNSEGTTMREFAAAILRDAPQRFALGGFSMGGYIAFEIMRQAPERVLKLALIDTSARPDTTEATEKRKGGIELARAGKLSLAAANTFPSAVHPSNVGNAELKAIHLEMAMTNGADAYIRQQQATMVRPDSRPTLATIKVPTLVLVGEADQITPVDAATEMARGIDGAWLVRVEDAGHFALIEQPGSVNDALAEWLSDD